MTRRFLLGVGIVVVWAGMLGWHVRREYFPPELTRLERAVLTLAPGMNFYALMMEGQSIGISSSLLDTIPDGGGFILEEVMSLELQALGQAGAATARTRVSLSNTLLLQDFSFSMTSSAGTLAVEGFVQGDSLLVVDLETGGQVERLTYRVPEPPLFTAALPIRLAKGGELRVGRSFRFPVFDPSTVAMRTVEIEVLEEAMLFVPDSAVFDGATGRWEPSAGGEVRGWRLRETFGGISTESWIDEDGRVLSSSSPLGFSIERMPYEMALQLQQGSQAARAAGTASDLIFSTAIASNVLLDDLESIPELRFRLSGVDLTGFDLDGGRQELRGDTLIIRRENWFEIDPGYSLPYPRGDLRGTLEPEPLIQSADERILQRAREIVGIGGGGRSNPVAVAERLTLGVNVSLRKEVSFSIPSALQVLETGAGDCNEHTVLFVALARSQGLPARIAVGLVYLEGAFYYHAWPEVWLGDWVAVDPTFGQVPADAAHLRFITGGLAQQVELARLIGALRIEVLR